MITPGQTVGRTTTRSYRAWREMKGRCANSDRADYKYYGGRGISYISVWGSFEAFYEDMGDPPDESFELDRIDNDKWYCKANCRWATKLQQANNKRLYSTNKSGVKGVCFVRGLWVATARHEGRQIQLLSGRDFFEVVCARKAWEAKVITPIVRGTS